LKVTIRESIVSTDGRGFWSRPIPGDEVRAVSNIHLVSLEPGSVRGNHYHESQTESICVIGGRVRLVALDEETGEKIDTILEGASAPVITIPPGIVHALKNIGSETNYLLCFSRLDSGSWEGDVRRRVILE
jgi:dTDP-4-dehydrorhamnose 3,5-epimerase-like enzyme